MKTNTTKSTIAAVLPPLLALVGIYKFTTSFFLAKHSLPHISSCADHAASQLLEQHLGLDASELDLLRHYGWLSTSTPTTIPTTDTTDAKTTTTTTTNIKYGCWMNRRVESMAVIVVDALRFDFALEHLPLSIGSRLARRQANTTTSTISTSTSTSTSTSFHSNSQLFQFVADPPTVTMQRLKGLTTGGLPTFADISGSFGGANVDEDSWVDQLKHVPFTQRLYNYDYNDDSNENVNKNKNKNAHDKRHHQQQQTKRRKMAFVGDDTWIDLFPTQFDDAHPYPSFNTRDLDTVDNGCLLHLPRLLRQFHSGLLELMVVHFLGVDHVGHTYGPHNVHMDQKLHQTDEALAKILHEIDLANSTCQTVFVLGDHGMTEDGNHGGGTDLEMNAALFAHFSPGCGDMTNIMNMNMNMNDGMGMGMEAGSLAKQAFQSIHQIDLVPTISLLLGLPIPYANLGGLVPALLPPSVSIPNNHYHNDHDKNDHYDNHTVTTPSMEAPSTATALALNAAQVWNYLTSYSQKSNTLPYKDIQELKEKLQHATRVYQSALSTLSTNTNTNTNPGNQDSATTTTTSHNTNMNIPIIPPEHISMEFLEASGLFKLFLSEATEMGKRVWTRFDTVGMGIGIFILSLSFLRSIPLSWNNINIRQWKRIKQTQTQTQKQKQSPPIRSFRFRFKSLLLPKDTHSAPMFQFLIYGIAIIFIVFHCILLTFSNSYIEGEQGIVMFMLAILCMFQSFQWCLVSLRDECYKRLTTLHTTVTTTTTTRTRMPHTQTLSFPNSIYMYMYYYKVPGLLLLLPLCSRFNEQVVLGHGSDPSLQNHMSHHPLFFSMSLFILGILRYQIFQCMAFPMGNLFPTLVDDDKDKDNGDTTKKDSLQTSPIKVSWFHNICDFLPLVFLAYSWNEKYSTDNTRHGYHSSLVALILPFVSLIAMMMGLFYVQNLQTWIHRVLTPQHSNHTLTTNKKEKLYYTSSKQMHGHLLQQTIMILYKVVLLIITVTGPSSAATAVLFVMQMWALYQIVNLKETQQIPIPLLSIIYRLVIRHTFFATGHACSFNRLQFSAAFVATDVFHFVLAGISLFLNTFGWEIVGSIMVVIIATVVTGKKGLKEWYFFYQLLEALCACISVSLMRRHLMVWAIFAPRFVFGTIFFGVTSVCVVIMTIFVGNAQQKHDHEKIRKF